MKKLIHFPGSEYQWVTLLDIQTTTRTELIDITDRVRAVVRDSGIKDGLCAIMTRHTTCSIIINENERSLRTDILRMLEKLIPQDQNYAHDQIDNNAHSHLRAILLGMSEIIPVEDGHLVLGTWQSIFFVELDGPRNRSVNIKILES